MTSPLAISFTGEPVRTPEQRQKRQEQVASGVGGAAGVTTATRFAGKRALKHEAKADMLAEMYAQVGRTMNNVNEGTQVTSGMWHAFKANMTKYTRSVETLMLKMKDAKFIGPIIKSPITAKYSALAGGALAFFVLVTGINKAARSGALAVDDLKNKYSEYKAAA